MNRLVIIGNGFDLAHGLKTSYKDFINWYWEQRLNFLLTEHSNTSSDCLCTLIRKANSGWFSYAYNNSFFKNYDGKWKKSPKEEIEKIINTKDDFDVEFCPFFENITKSIETKGWVDIENEYYKLLKKYYIQTDECKKLNEQLKFLQDKLVEYLKSLPQAKRNNEIADLLEVPFKEKDIYIKDWNIARSSMRASMDIPLAEYKPENIILLSFNYTNTVEMYTSANTKVNYIHGSLSNEDEIIFGYGDELDKDYKDILDKNDNELLNHAKSVKYLEADNYRSLLEFIEAQPFQVFIMGHSCGNSDRTLLNTIFEHKNCVSIKPFYYKKTDGTDTYLYIAQNIYRNFTDMKLLRGKVVNKTRCISLPQNQKQ